jgi:predicted DNA-binding protein
VASKRLSVRINGGLHGKLRKEAVSRGKAESDVVREALEHYLSIREQGETCYDLAEKLGSIGCVKRAPKDLSTNRKHFVGFGR